MFCENTLLCTTLLLLLRGVFVHIAQLKLDYFPLLVGNSLVASKFNGGLRRVGRVLPLYGCFLQTIAIALND